MRCPLSIVFPSLLPDFSMTISKQCRDVRLGEFLIIGGRPCKVLEVEKLPSSQILIVGRDFFNGGVVEERRPPDYIVEEPKISKAEYTITEYDEEDNSITIQCERTGQRRKIKIPEVYIGDDLKAAIEEHDGPMRVTVASTCGEEGIVAFQKC